MNLKRVIYIIFGQTEHHEICLSVEMSRPTFLCAIVRIALPEVSSVNFLLIFLLCSEAIQPRMMVVAA